VTANSSIEPTKGSINSTGGVKYSIVYPAREYIQLDFSLRIQTRTYQEPHLQAIPTDLSRASNRSRMIGHRTAYLASWMHKLFQKREREREREHIRRHFVICTLFACKRTYRNESPRVRRLTTRMMMNLFEPDTRSKAVRSSRRNIAGTFQPFSYENRAVDSVGSVPIQLDRYSKPYRDLTTFPRCDKIARFPRMALGVHNFSTTLLSGISERRSLIVNGERG